MSVVKTDRSPWQPITAGDRQEVLAELDAILASPHFCNSKRYPALLRYVVESALHGRPDLKERTLGIEVFHRPADYDTNSDTIVRFTAGEVRKRLSLYYHDQQDESRIQITLPAGSYTPEFLLAGEEIKPTVLLDAGTAPSPISVLPVDHELHPLLVADRPAPARTAHLWKFATALLLVILAAAGWWFRSRKVDVLDQFWRPAVGEGQTTLICPGGVVFAPNNLSGVQTAKKDTQYPFVSMQIATAIGQLGGVLQREGAKYEVRSAVGLPLNDLRERPVILLGGYNNEWSIRLLSGLRYHFSLDPEGVIVDGQGNGRWERDKTQSYSSADDYALVARFRDVTTGSMVVVLAGLGRNGSEAAAEFATNPHYLAWLHDQIGNDLHKKNLEIVLKTRVIDGKTGAPSVVALHRW